MPFDDSDFIRYISYYCINYGRSTGNSCIGNNVIFCLQQYNCNMEELFSGHRNNIIESYIGRCTDCSHNALANLLHELIMARDGLLVLPEWFTCNNI